MCVGVFGRVQREGEGNTWLKCLACARKEKLRRTCQLICDDMSLICDGSCVERRSSHHNVADMR
eukprot:538705-Rhodomonas_salina.2